MAKGVGNGNGNGPVVRLLTKRHWVYLTILVGCQALLAGLVLVVAFPHKGSPFSGTGPAWLAYVLFLSALIVILFTVLVLEVFLPSEETRHGRHAIRRSLLRWHLLISWRTFITEFGKHLTKGTFYGALLTLASLAVFYVILSGAGTSDLWPRLASDAGTFFAMALGIVTLTGFFITIGQIRERYNLITNYEELFAATANRLQKALSTTELEDKEIWFVGVTPLNGNASFRGSALLKRYLAKLDSAVGRPGDQSCSLRLLCYRGDEWNDNEAEKSPLQRYYHRLEHGKDAFEEAFSFIKRIRNSVTYWNSESITDRQAQTHIHRMLEIVPNECSKFPSYRAVVTSKWAIVYVPVLSGEVMEGGEKSHFQMIGFETSVDTVVHWIRHQFEEAWEDAVGQAGTSISEVER